MRAATTTRPLASAVTDDVAAPVDFYDEEFDESEFDTEDMEFDKFDADAASEKDDKSAPSVPIRQFRRPKKIPLLAVVGRPNVGKSALVNRFAATQ